MKKKLSMEIAVYMLTSRTAGVFGITDRGKLEIGLGNPLKRSRKIFVGRHCSIPSNKCRPAKKIETFLPAQDKYPGRTGDNILALYAKRLRKWSVRV